MQKNMRFELWHSLEAWKEIFDKYRANAQNDEDVIEAIYELIHDDNVAATGIVDNSIVDLDDTLLIDTLAESVCELLGEMHRDTKARLENLAN